MDVVGTSTIVFFINEKHYLLTHTQLLALKETNQNRSRAQNIALGANQW